MPQTETNTQTTPKPIPMSPWSVRRILAGAKTETRRVIGDVPPSAKYLGWHTGIPGRVGFEFEEDNVLIEPDLPFGLDPRRMPKHYGRLYVREPVYRGEDGIARYQADDEKVQVHRVPDGPRVDTRPVWRAPNDVLLISADWRRKWSRDRQPSIFMPKAWSRILLEVTEVGVERVFEIDVEDVIAEGIGHDEIRRMYSERGKSLLPNGGSIETLPDRKWVQAFRWKWEELHGGGSWEENPYVWVLKFYVLHPEVG